MSFTPFDDEPQSPSDNNPFETTSAEKETKTVVVNEANEGKYTVTLKGGTGFDSPWIVVHAMDAADALKQLQDPNLKTLIDRASEVGRYFASLSGGGAAPAQRPAAQSTGGGRPAYQAPPGDVAEDDKHCAHGERVFKSGVNKNGKPYKAMFCPSRDRDNQCAPKWI